MNGKKEEVKPEQFPWQIHENLGLFQLLGQGF